MCVVSKPDIPPPPPPPQEQKTPDSMSQRRANRKPMGMGAGTLLTTPSGVATSGLNLGGSTLLGG